MRDEALALVVTEELDSSLCHGFLRWLCATSPRRNAWKSDYSDTSALLCRFVRPNKTEGSSYFGLWTNPAREHSSHGSRVSRHRIALAGRPDRLLARAKAARTGPPGGAHAARAGGLPRDPAVRGGRAGARLSRRAAARTRGDPARLDSRNGRPRARFRPSLPADLTPGAPALGADGHGHPTRRGVPADRRLPDRRSALR